MKNRFTTRFTFHHFILGFFMFLLSCVSTKTNNATNILFAKDLKPLGRYIFNHESNLELISSAVHFGFSFEGKEIILDASNAYSGGHNYIQYELDGAYHKRIKISGAAGKITIAAPRDGRHTVWIYKATEAHTGAVIIKSITGRNLRPLQKPDGPMIEFIGNSITCGAAADPSEVPCGTGQYHDQHNAYYAYGPRVARALKTNFIVSGVSGIGIYRNWNSDGPAMPELYEKADFQYSNTMLWNFKTYTPKIVSIALGTNDLSRGDGIKKRSPFDSATFVNSYIEFVQSVKSKYPSSQIALLSSPMSSGNDRVLLQNCLSAVKQKLDALFLSDKKIALHFFKPMKARGCTGHPNVEDHAILAEELIPFFKKLL